MERAVSEAPPAGGRLSLHTHELRYAVGVALLLIGVGGALGLVAAAVTPHVAQTLFQDPTQGYPRALFLAVAEEDKAAIGGDAVVLVVLVAGGLLAGAGSLALRRIAPFGAVIGIVVGGLLGGALTMAVAHIVVHRSDAAVPLHAVNTGAVFQLRPYIRGRVDFVAFPSVALVTFLAGNLPWYVRTRSAAGRGTELGAPEPLVPVPAAASDPPETTATR